MGVRLRTEYSRDEYLPGPSRHAAPATQACGTRFWGFAPRATKTRSNPEEACRAAQCSRAGNGHLLNRAARPRFSWPSLVVPRPAVEEPKRGKWYFDQTAEARTDPCRRWNRRNPCSFRESIRGYA